ncbi:MAG: nitroreductase [Bacteroidia bacterium]|nr:nitroreductase [Bacteroidia bacterium]
METTSTSEFEFPVIDEIKKRRSIRAFSDRAIGEEKIRSLFEAARWAPSSVNEQPWYYLYATKEQPALWQKLFKLMNDGNKLWAQHAPLLIVSLARKNYTKNGHINSTAHYDLGQANAFLSLQAVDLGLQVHQIGGYSKRDAISELNIPDMFEPGPMMAIGYPGDMTRLSEQLQSRETATRVRMQQKDYIRNQSF